MEGSWDLCRAYSTADIWYVEVIWFFAYRIKNYHIWLGSEVHTFSTSFAQWPHYINIGILCLSYLQSPFPFLFKPLKPFQREWIDVYNILFHAFLELHNPHSKIHTRTCSNCNVILFILPSNTYVTFAGDLQSCTPSFSKCSVQH